MHQPRINQDSPIAKIPKRQPSLAQLAKQMSEAHQKFCSLLSVDDADRIATQKAIMCGFRDQYLAALEQCAAKEGKDIADMDVPEVFLEITRIKNEEQLSCKPPVGRKFSRHSMKLGEKKGCGFFPVRKG
jgi:hypothetical protein